MGILHDRPELRARRRELRRCASHAERLLWSALRKRGATRRIRRQHSVGPYVLDFYCPAARLAVELDGSAHDSAEAERRDAVRSAYLARCGIRVIRFVNDEVERDLEAVVQAIANEVAR